jgi:hypothetical protein
VGETIIDPSGEKLGRLKTNNAINKLILIFFPKQ